jgi:thiamine biosynthesis protein ThiI
MKGLLLLSGGFDSPVAGYLMKQKGLEIIPVHFSLRPFTKESDEDKPKKLANIIGCKKIFIVPQGESHAEIVKKCKHEYYYIISRRLMLRIAETIAKKEKCGYIITGDSLGQVGSQTLENMHVISKATDMIILRPLLTNDKQETIDFARKIGTFETSCGPELCSVLGPKHPATKSRLKIIELEEQKVDINSMVEKGVKEAIQVYV